jgi:hypothetical protein
VERTDGSSYQLLLLFNERDGHNSKSKHNIVYPNIPSALKPVECDNSMLIPKPLQQLLLHEEEQTSTTPEEELGPACSNVDPDFPELTVPHLTSQYEINGLVKILNLSKILAELLASRLQGWNL